MKRCVFLFLLLSLPSWLSGKKFARFFFFFFFCGGRTVFCSLILAVKLEIITKNQRLAPKMESKGRIMSEHNEKWKAEEAIGGNRAAVEALRELITFPLLYSSQAQKLGLKVSCNLQSFFILIYSLLILISGFFFFSLFSFSGLEVFSYMVHRAPARYHSHFYPTKVNIKEKKLIYGFILLTQFSCNARQAWCV